MRKRYGRVADRLFALHRPLGQFRDQPPGPLVRLVKVDVVKRYADAQITDDLDLLVNAGQII